MGGLKVPQWRTGGARTGNNMQDSESKCFLAGSVAGGSGEEAGDATSHHVPLGRSHFKES